MKRLAILLAFSLAGCGFAGRAPTAGHASFRLATVPAAGGTHGSLVVRAARHDGAPEPGVLVQLIDRRAGPFTGGTADSTGMLALDSVPAGAYRVRIVRLGLKRLEMPVRVRAGFADTLAATLEPSELMLDCTLTLP